MNLRTTKIMFFAAVGLVVAAGIFFWYRYYFRYNVNLDLTPEQKIEYEEKVRLMDGKIKSVKYPDKPDIDFFIEKARYQEYLGKYGKAIQTLLEAFKYYENTTAGWNNIARLYDKVGDYQSATVFYKKLIEMFRLNQYYVDLARDFYMLGQYKLAYEAYGRFAQLTGMHDGELFTLINSKLKQNE